MAGAWKSVIGLGLARLLISCPGRYDARLTAHQHSLPPVHVTLGCLQSCAETNASFHLVFAICCSDPAQCLATTPASLACAVMRRLYACTEPSKCSIVPLSHTHKLVHTFCSIVTS